MIKSIFQFACIFAFSLILHTTYAQNTQERNVGSFNQIKIGGAYDVFIKKGSSASVRLEGPTKDLDKITTEVKDGVLKVQKKKNVSWGWNAGKSVKVYITYTELKGLHSSGSSDVKVENTVNASDFSLSCSGSGDIHIPLKVSSLSARISGSGDMEIEGNCDEENFSISGSGDIEASGLEAKKATLKISGSGSIRLHVTDYLEGHISGSGKVRYKGDPRQKVKISGSGSVRQE